MFKLNKRGMGIIEVMVAAGMAIIVSLGVANMMQNQYREGRRSTLMYAILEKRKAIDYMLRDPNIWTAILNNNAAAPFTTLRLTSGVSTTEIAYTSPVEFQIYNGDGTLKWNLLGPSDTTGPYNGFTEKGTECATFYAGAGTGRDDCPFSYRLLVASDCASGSGCINPQLKLVARLVFNPAPTGPLTNFAGTLGAIAGTNISDTVADSKYDSVIKRTSTSINRSFKITSGFTPASGCASMTEGGGGNCSTTAPYGAIHPRTDEASVASGLWDESANNDPTNLITVNANGTFRFNETGFYACSISVPAFGTNGFTAYLMTGGAPIAQASVTAGEWSQSVAVIDTKFNVTSTAADYQINQKCDSAAANFCALGIPSSSYGVFQVLVTMSCYKVDKAY